MIDRGRKRENDKGQRGGAGSYLGNSGMNILLGRGHAARHISLAHG
jgi:hypothetical protein